MALRDAEAHEEKAPSAASVDSLVAVVADPLARAESRHHSSTRDSRLATQRSEGPLSCLPDPSPSEGAMGKKRKDSDSDDKKKKKKKDKVPAARDDAFYVAV